MERRRGWWSTRRETIGSDTYSRALSDRVMFADWHCLQQMFVNSNPSASSTEPVRLWPSAAILARQRLLGVGIWVRDAQIRDRCVLSICSITAAGHRRLPVRRHLSCSSATVPMQHPLCHSCPLSDSHSHCHSGSDTVGHHPFHRGAVTRSPLPPALPVLASPSTVSSLRNSCGCCRVSLVCSPFH